MPQMKALTMENRHMVQTECKQSDGTTSETETFIQFAEKSTISPGRGHWFELLLAHF